MTSSEINNNLTKKMQDREAEMLKNLSEIFKKNDISYFLACGTALGCVRHGGFIPWDDDVDIYMFAKDYYKLKEVFKKEG